MNAACLSDSLAARPANETVFTGFERNWRTADVLEELDLLVEHLAGIRVCAILADNSPNWALVDLAALRNRTPVLPLPLFFSPTQLYHALQQTGTDLVITDQPERILSLELGFSVKEIRGKLAWLYRQCSPVSLPAGTAKISFTSGSTGTPKGVCLSAEGLINTAVALQSGLCDIPIKRHLAVLPLALLLENSAGIYAALLRGAEIHLPPLASIGWQGMSGFNAKSLHDSVSHVRPNSLILVPELLKAWTLFLTQRQQHAPDSLSFVAVGGSRVEPALLLQARGLGLPVYQGYGLTECGSVVSLNRPGDEGQGVGRPLSHIQATVQEGEVHIATSAFLGYLGDSQIRTGNDYATGDLGYFDACGHLHLSGRSKNLLITSFGRNISPEWIEAGLLAQPQIAQVLVAGDGQPTLSAIVVPFPGISREEVDSAIRRSNSTLPDYARVGSWIEADPFTAQNGLLTGNGRPIRAAILDHYAANLSAINYSQHNKEYVNVVL